MFRSQESSDGAGPGFADCDPTGLCRSSNASGRVLRPSVTFAAEERGDSEEDCPDDASVEDPEQ